MRKLSNSREDRAFADWISHRGFLGHTLGSQQLDSYLAILARSSDYAVAQYELARECVESNGMNPDGTHTLGRVSAINHLETCVVVLMRSLRCLDRLSSKNKGLAISRVQRKLAQQAIKALRPVRDTIEHMDSAICKGEIKADKPHSLAVYEAANTAAIGDLTLALDDLHQGLTALRCIVRELIRGTLAGTAA